MTINSHQLINHLIDLPVYSDKRQGKFHGSKSFIHQDIIMSIKCDSTKCLMIKQVLRPLL